MQKKCPKCGIVKDISDFHKNNKTKDGYACHCKECRKIYKAKAPKKYVLVEFKTCNTCKKIKSISEFHISAFRKDGHKNDCKSCLEIKSKEYLKNGKRIVIEKVCRKCGILKPISMFHNARGRYDGHNEVCKDCICKYPVGYADDLRRKILQSGQKICTRCKKIQPLSEFYKRKDGKLGYTPICRSCWAKKYADYYENNYEKIIEIGEKRRALERGLENNFTKEDWIECMADFEYKCAYCGNHSRKLQQEHFISVIKLGTYTRGNILPACPHCNQSKGSGDFVEWFREQSFYSKEREIFIFDYLQQFKGGDLLGNVL
jgi:hypothetical protein